MSLGTEVGLGPDHIVLDGDPAPPSKGHSSPPCFGSIYCGQMAGWIKMPLGTEVGIGSGDTVLDVPPKRAQQYSPSPTFRPMSIVAKQSPISATTELLFLISMSIT